MARIENISGKAVLYSAILLSSTFFATKGTQYLLNGVNFLYKFIKIAWDGYRTGKSTYDILSSIIKEDSSKENEDIQAILTSQKVIKQISCVMGVAAFAISGVKLLTGPTVIVYDMAFTVKGSDLYRMYQFSISAR